MRRRIVGAIVLVALLTLALYAVPRSVMVDDLVRDAERRALDHEVALVAKAIDHRLKAGGAIDQGVVDDLAARGQQVVVELADGTRIATTDLGDDVLSAAAPVPAGGRVELSVDAGSVDQQVRDALGSVIAIALAAAAAAVVLAVIVSRRVVRPFTELAAHAADLGPDIHDPAPRSGLPEADRIAAALDLSRDRLAQLLTDEREFSANASHQLRTPLAALRLRLEDLTLWPEANPAVRDELTNALAEVDRLSGTITDLLALARRGGIGTAGEVDLVEAASSAVGRWRSAFEERGRTLALDASGLVVVPTSLGAVQQVLDVLLENALVHGAGAVRIVVAADDSGGRVGVTDEGTIDDAAIPELFERSRSSSAHAGEGIGLALARTLAAAVGARLRLASTSPTTFDVAFARRRP